MRSFKHIIIISILTVLLFSQCKKNQAKLDDGLPKATQIGANIFACKVNGENWISKKSSGRLGGGISNDTFFIYGSNPQTTHYYERFDIRNNHFSNNLSKFMLTDTIISYVLFSTNKPI